MKIIITGILGQDGANMAEYLLQNTNAKIFGMMRRSANPNYINCKSFEKNSRFEFVYGDLTDSVSIDNLVREIQPDFFINFGAQSFVGCSWDIPLQTFDVNATGVVRCLEAIRRFKPECRFYSAGSSEEFGDVAYSPQDINHPLRPRSPYGASKASARHVVKVYRDSYKLYAVHGILFNHEGTKRGEEFVTRKISKGVARIHNAIKNKQIFEPINLGNLDSKRDWSDSEDFIDGVWKMLNQKQPKDYVLSSNETHSIREFIFRKELGWEPKISFDKLVEKMVRFDIDNFLK
jgi:GDPmannose 4,6-dehydratase